MSQDDDPDEAGLEATLDAVMSGLDEFRIASAHAVRTVQQWIQRQRLSVRLGVPAVLGWVFSAALTEIWRTTLRAIGQLGPVLASFHGVSVSTGQLVIVALGAIAGNTWYQARKLNTIEYKIDDMDYSPIVLTDGGARRTRENPAHTTGGGAIGGLIAGGALGSSFGPQGAVVGALVGAVLGDSIEHRSETRLTSHHRTLLGVIEARKGTDPFTPLELEELLKKNATGAGLDCTSVSRSTLDRLAAMGYLRRLQTSNRSTLVVDLGREGARSASVGAARTDQKSKLRELVSKVLEREGIDDGCIECVDFDDVEGVIDAVNGAVGDSVLAVVRQPCKYQLTEKARGTVESTG